MKTRFELGEKSFEFELPEGTDILQMAGSGKVENPTSVIQDCLDNPVGTAPFDNIVRSKLRQNQKLETVIVISDNTRPVPYKGEQGILLPLVNRLLKCGVSATDITILCANGTHTPLPESTFREMLDPALFEMGIRVINHDCLDLENLVDLGRTSAGTQIRINRMYLEADLKILTGLVESHFMAGVSGGRKSICPGLVGEDSTFIFHGVENLSNENSRDLVLKGNPCHEEAMEVATKAGADFILNVTLTQDLDVSGYFAGDMNDAHLQAFEKVKNDVLIENTGPYDIVITHAGFVGRNHYQAAKAGVAAIPLLKHDGFLIIAGDCTDIRPVGKDSYRKVLPHLKDKSVKEFLEELSSPDWKFIPDQWQVQMWGKVFEVIPQDHLIYYAPQIPKSDYGILPGVDGNTFLDEADRYKDKDGLIPVFLERAIEKVTRIFIKLHDRQPRIAWLADGPYGIVQD